MTSSKRLLTFGALSIVFSPTDPDEVVSVGSIVIAEAVTWTDSTTASTSIRTSIRKGCSSAGMQKISVCPFIPPRSDNDIAAVGYAGEPKDTEFIRLSCWRSRRLGIRRIGSCFLDRLQAHLSARGAKRSWLGPATTAWPTIEEPASWADPAPGNSRKKMSNRLVTDVTPTDTLLLTQTNRLV